MTLHSIDSKVFGLKKEGSRGVAETSPSRYIAVDRSSEMDYVPALLEDEQLRGLQDRILPLQGVKTGTGKIKIDIEPENCGELFLSLLGYVANVTTLKAGSAYKHTFTRLAGLQHQSYTIFVDRSLGVKKYNLGVVKKAVFEGSPDGKATMDCDMLFKSEADASALSPSWTAPIPFMFHHTDVKIATQSNTDVKSWTINVDNQAFGQRVLNQNKDVSDIICPGKLLIDGSFEIYFQDETERDKFLANNASKFEVVLIGDEICSGYHYELAIILHEIHYTAYPFADIDGLLGAGATFNAYYNISASQSIKIELTNTISDKY